MRRNKVVSAEDSSQRSHGWRHRFGTVKNDKGNYFLSSPRYSKDTFSKHQLKEDFVEADPEQRIHHNFEETRKSLRVRDL
ncbi:MAG: hypothetical protein M3316_00015 [Actinomycetota bacterium]|nr:hypothetical protein [Actinomycetota bacterium]